jgi:outer membrane receptor protein involved in Fe transport
VAFAASVEDPIANVTLKTTPQLITRERQNLGRTRSRGVEADAEARLGRWWEVSAGYALIDAVVTSFAATPDLVGNQLPQVPRHQATFAVRFNQPRLFQASVESRVSSEQFDDDQNQLPLPGYVTLDARVSRKVGRVSVFAVGENLTDKRYAVGLTPTPTVGPPRSFRAGMRFE